MKGELELSRNGSAGACFTLRAASLRSEQKEGRKRGRLRPSLLRTDPARISSATS